MRKLFKITLAFIIVVAAIFAYFWPVIKMELAGSAHYTEENKKEYEHYTPDILKKIPRISAHYEFDFYNVAGPGSLIYSVIFYGTTDTSKINAYLISRHYVKQDNCSVEGECWRESDPGETITVSVVPKINAVTVQVDNSPQF